MTAIKTKEEIALLREGGRRHAAIMRELVAMVKPGLDIFDIDRRARELIKEQGDTPAFLNYQPSSKDDPFPAAICISINEEVVHGLPTRGKILKEGDIVTLDLGLTHKKMITDMSVSVAVGAVSPEARKLIDVTEQALRAGIKAAKGGRHIGDIGAAIEQVASAHGVTVVHELCGHGVGHDVHESPLVPNYGDEGKGPLLKPGMVLAIEPVFCLGEPDIEIAEDGFTYVMADGSLSAQSEHTVLITKGDAEILTA